MDMNRQSECVAFPMSIGITLGGRDYAICNEGQMQYLRYQAREKIVSDAMDESKTLTEEETRKKLEEWQVGCKFLTMSMLFAKMTPEQKEEWKAQYRFTPVSRRISIK